MRIKDLREDADITQKQLANYLNIKQNTYSQYENGQRQIPIDALVKLALYFKTSTDYILELTNETKPYPRNKKNWKYKQKRHPLGVLFVLAFTYIIDTIYF